MPPSHCFILKYSRVDIEEAERLILTSVERCHYDSTSCFAIRLALEEALANAFKHGNREDPRKTVRLDCRIDHEAIEICVEDEGDGFDPDTVPDPTAEENLEIPAGRGLALMRGYMSEVRIHPPGNRVEMKYIRRRSQA